MPEKGIAYILYTNDNTLTFFKSKGNTVKAFTIKGKTALVTGANRGIGKGFIKILLEQGAKKIFAAARDIDALKPIVALNPEVIEPVLLDVTNTMHIKALPEKISSLDILINNAGIVNSCGTSSPNTVEITRQEMATNFYGPVQITIELLALLKQSKQAAIINLSSIAGISSFPNINPYSASKAALHSYTQGLRAELSHTNIRVVGVYPGPIDTRMSAGIEMDKAKPEQVAIRTFSALEQGVLTVLPDDFSAQMYALFLEHPNKLESAFAEMR